MSFKPDIRLDDIKRRMGGKRKSTLSRSTHVKTEHCRKLLAELMRPRLHYARLSIESIEKGKVKLKNGTVLRSAKLARSLGKSTLLTAFVATIGSGVDEEIRQLMDNGLASQGFILDSIGSVAAENMIEQFQRETARRLREDGLALTLRFSPGYCDWPVTEQKKLFSLFLNVDTGVRLTDSCLMIPRKSVSGVFGIYPIVDGFRDRPYNPCPDCGNLDCSARRNDSSHIPCFSNEPSII